MSWKRHFSRFFDAAPGRLHFAAHSHHPWPDASFEAQRQAWEDAARLADLKWDKVFGEVLPDAQRHVAAQLRLPDPRTVAFAPNTHEFLLRLLSCLPVRPRVLTTDGEFHSFARQLARIEEDGAVVVERVPVAPFASFAARFAAAAQGSFDLVYFSQCFYNSGFLLEDPAALVTAVRSERALVVIDGYHAFMATPVDLSAIAGRAFYLAGGYKYAMAGEGACFLHCPPGQALRPPNTGWFAAFGTLAGSPDGGIAYAEGGLRFMGATFDPTALYRFNAVQEWLRREGLTPAAIRAHVLDLQACFLELCAVRDLLPGAERLPPAGLPQGNFLVFRHDRAREWQRRLLAGGVLTDSRDDRLRIGFGIFQDRADVAALAARIGGLEPPL